MQHDQLYYELKVNGICNAELPFIVHFHALSCNLYDELLKFCIRVSTWIILIFSILGISLPQGAATTYDHMTFGFNFKDKGIVIGFFDPVATLNLRDGDAIEQGYSRYTPSGIWIIIFKVAEIDQRDNTHTI